MGCCLATFLAKKDLKASSSNSATGCGVNLMYTFASELLGDDGSDIRTRFAGLSMVGREISDAFL